MKVVAVGVSVDVLDIVPEGVDEGVEEGVADGVHFVRSSVETYPSGQSKQLSPPVECFPGGQSSQSSSVSDPSISFVVPSANANNQYSCKWKHAHNSPMSEHGILSAYLDKSHRQMRHYALRTFLEGSSCKYSQIRDTSLPRTCILHNHPMRLRLLRCC